MLKRIHRLGDRQFGVVTRNDLRRCGLTDSQTKRLVRNEALIRVHRGVYRLPGSQTTTESEALAACLAIGPHAVASHTTAERLWRVLGRAEALPEVTVPRDRRSRKPTVVVHRPLRLDRNERTRIGPIPVTRVARTLDDLASRLPSDDLEEALDEALRRRLVTPGSRLERVAIAVPRESGLPEPARQFFVGLSHRPRASRPALPSSSRVEPRTGDGSAGSRITTGATRSSSPAGMC